MLNYRFGLLIWWFSLAQWLHPSQSGSLRWEGWTWGRRGSSGVGRASTGAGQPQGCCYGDGQEEGEDAWVHGEPCSGGGCGVGWAAVGACGHGGGDVGVRGGVPPCDGVCAVIRYHLIRGRGADGCNLNTDGSRTTWVNHQSILYWWNTPELRSGELNKSTQFPRRACQITAGTPHREETLDPLLQVDNARHWIFNYGAGKATKKSKKSRELG